MSEVIQDFGSARGAVFNGDADAIRRLRSIAFDVLRVGGDDLRSRPWSERDEMLRRSVPVCDRVRVIESRPASRERHDAIVALGFEGTVLKRRRSTYWSGRQSAWVKHKARQVAQATAVEVREDRNGWRWVFCDVDGRRVVASAAGADESLIGRPNGYTFWLAGAGRSSEVSVHIPSTFRPHPVVRKGSPAPKLSVDTADAASGDPFSAGERT